VVARSISSRAPSTIVWTRWSAMPELVGSFYRMGVGARTPGHVQDWLVTKNTAAGGATCSLPETRAPPPLTTRVAQGRSSRHALMALAALPRPSRPRGLAGHPGPVWSRRVARGPNAGHLRRPAEEVCLRQLHRRGVSDAERASTAFRWERMLLVVYPAMRGVPFRGKSPVHVVA
jgi:hypothetical protein